MGFKFLLYFSSQVLVDYYSKFKNATSHKVHELKSSAANDTNIISIPTKSLPGKCCGQGKKKYSLTHDASSLLDFTFTECQNWGIMPVLVEF